MKAKPFLRKLFDAALAAVSPDRVLPAHLPAAPPGRTVVLAVGKAATAMADAVAMHWGAPLTGLAVTRYGHVLPGFARHEHIELIEAGHPIPDENSMTGARRALALARELGKDDLALVLISGGGSALWCLPVPGLGLSDQQCITAELLASGASIRELNTVRKALSAIKGGKLAEAAAPARVETLIISDVVGDDPAMIASGPTIPGGETLADARAILRRYGTELPGGVRDARDPPSSPPALRDDNQWRIVASSADALAAAAEVAREAGFAVRVLGAVEGDAREAAAVHARITREVRRGGKPTVILSGGELTVKVRDRNGIGGPNTEFLLALALELEGAADTWAIACDTDGCDGVASSAGALIGPGTLERAKMLGADPWQALDASDSARFFEALQDVVVTGPTQTNVSDFRAILVGRTRH
ncbi:MAG TPA: glycerate kinase [Woeseiaceae bacterium]|nr:glycerate kinase [Woeseiaceae bacterium]